MNTLVQLLTLLAASTVSAGTFEGITSVKLGPGWVEVPGTAGWGFRPNTVFQIQQLGVFDDTPLRNRTPLTVGLWNESGGLLASVQVGTNDQLINQWRYADITPVTVMTGETYLLGVYAPTGAVSGHDLGGGNTSFTPAAEIQYLGFARSANRAFQVPQLVANGQGYLFAGPNFRSIPEPSTLTFLGLALALAAAWFSLKPNTTASSSALPPPPSTAAR